MIFLNLNQNAFKMFRNFNSIFYVFYEQYLTIWKDTIYSLLLSLVTIFSVSFVLTGFDLLSAVVILLMVTLILINMLGLMWLWNITLNAVSLVNLVVVRIVNINTSIRVVSAKENDKISSNIQSIGIGVEFISHIVRAFSKEIGTNEARASRALSVLGSSVLSGITLTKFSGILILASSSSQVKYCNKFT